MALFLSISPDKRCLISISSMRDLNERISSLISPAKTSPPSSSNIWIVSSRYETFSDISSKGCSISSIFAFLF